MSSVLEASRNAFKEEYLVTMKHRKCFIQLKGCSSHLFWHKDMCLFQQQKKKKKTCWDLVPHETLRLTKMFSQCLYKRLERISFMLPIGHVLQLIIIIKYCSNESEGSETDFLSVYVNIQWVSKKLERNLFILAIFDVFGFYHQLLLQWTFRH